MYSVGFFTGNSRQISFKRGCRYSRKGESVRLGTLGLVDLSGICN